MWNKLKRAVILLTLYCFTVCQQTGGMSVTFPPRTESLNQRPSATVTVSVAPAQSPSPATVPISMQPSRPSTIPVTVPSTVPVTANTTTPVNPPAPTPPATNQQNKNKPEDSISTIYILINGDKSDDLVKYDVSKLNATQNQVDQFIRKKTKVGNANLTDARGNGQDYVYTYENKTNSSQQVWVITAKAVEEQNKSSVTTGVNDKTAQAAQPQPQVAGKQKYMITGYNYISTGPMSQEDKAKLNQQFKKQDEVMKKFSQDMNDFMKNFDESFSSSNLLSWL